MKWGGRYIVLEDGRLFWIEGYEFEPDEPVHKLLQASHEARVVFKNYGDRGVRIGES